MTYIATDEHLHQLCQTVAKINRSFVPKEEDDSHTNLYFDELDQRITGHWVKTSKGALLFSLNLAHYCFEWQNANKDVLYSYAIAGKTIDAWETEIAENLPAMGLEVSGFKDPLHFEITEYAFKDGVFHKPEETALAEWMQIRAFGNQACRQLNGYAQVEASIRIWPHHFDTGVYFEVDGKVGLGFGLAMKDSGTDVPYFYLSAYPNEGEIDYSQLPDIGAGSWMLSDGFNGALLTLDKPLEAVQADFAKYLKAAFNWFVNQV